MYLKYDDYDQGCLVQCTIDIVAMSFLDFAYRDNGLLAIMPTTWQVLPLGTRGCQARSLPHSIVL